MDSNRRRFTTCSISASRARAASPNAPATWIWHDLKVNFFKAAYPKSDKELLDEQEKAIEIGLTNQVEIIQDQRGVDEDEATEIFNENIATRNKNNERLNAPTLNEESTAIAMNLLPKAKDAWSRKTAKSRRGNRKEV